MEHFSNNSKTIVNLISEEIDPVESKRRTAPVMNYCRWRIMLCQLSVAFSHTVMHEIEPRYRYVHNNDNNGNLYESRKILRRIKFLPLKFRISCAIHSSAMIFTIYGNVNVLSIRQYGALCRRSSYSFAGTVQWRCDWRVSSNFKVTCARLFRSGQRPTGIIRLLLLFSSS